MSGVGTVDDSVLPEGWQKSKIGDHFDFKNGLNKAKHFFGHGTPIVNYMDVYRHPWLLPSQVRGKVSVTRTEQQAYSARQHDAFFTRTSETVAEIGMCSVLMGPIESAVFSGFVLRARPVSNRLLPGFAAYALRGREVRQQIEASATYTTRALTNGRSLSAVTFGLPPAREQESIGTALRDIDDLIGSLDALFAKKRDIKEAAMQQLLTGRARLQGVASTAMVQSELGQIPADWEVRTLSSLGEPIIGLTYQPTDVRASGTLVLRSSNVKEGELAFEDNVFVDPEVGSRALVAEGDILICVRNGSRALIGKCALIDDQAVGMAFGAFMTVYRSPHFAFLHHQFQSNTVQRQIHEHLGATINQITNASLRSFKVPFPKYEEERRAIAGVLSDMNLELRALSEKRFKLRSLREGMMQQLLTGRIRLQ